MGTAVAEDQIRLLQRMAQTAVFVLNGDKGGVDAVLRDVALARDVGLRVNVATLPAGRDPADIIAADGADRFAQLVDDAVSFPRFQLVTAIARAGISTPEGKDALLGALRPVFAHMPQSAVREDLVAHLADAVSFPGATVASWMHAPPPRSRPMPAT